MDRWACIDAFRFPLQIVLSEFPQWLEEPVAVLERDHPRALITTLNRRAHSAGLRRGMRYGEALALVPTLRAHTVDDETLQRRSDEAAQILGDFSPHVERHDDHPGTFWLDASGLCNLYPRWQQWVDPLRDRLKKELKLYVCIVIGFTRFGTFAVARATGRSGLFKSPQNERHTAGTVPLEKLGILPSAQRLAQRLGVRTIDELLALPPEGVRRRLGEAIFRLYRQARGDLQKPFSAVHNASLPSHTDHLDYAERDANRLLFLIKRHLHSLLKTLEKDGEKLVCLTIALHRDGTDPIEADIRPAQPTLDALLLLDLIRLRLESLPVEKGITDIVLTARGQRTTTEQMHLFAESPPRDIDAANRALARLRAEFGADAVLRLALCEGHLPESRFQLTHLDELQLPDGPSGDARPAVRRFFPSPIHLRAPCQAITRAGPHTICGGWWVREVHRDYHLVETEGRRLLWLFYDYDRRRWYVHGEF